MVTGCLAFLCVQFEGHNPLRLKTNITSRFFLIWQKTSLNPFYSIQKSFENGLIVTDLVWALTIEKTSFNGTVSILNYWPLLQVPVLFYVMIKPFRSDFFIICFWQKRWLRWFPIVVLPALGCITVGVLLWAYSHFLSGKMLVPHTMNNHLYGVFYWYLTTGIFAFLLSPSSAPLSKTRLPFLCIPFKAYESSVTVD